MTPCVHFKVSEVYKIVYINSRKQGKNEIVKREKQQIAIWANDSTRVERRRPGSRRRK
jgi:hypothetical protein